MKVVEEYQLAPQYDSPQYVQMPAGAELLYVEDGKLFVREDPAAALVRREIWVARAGAALPDTIGPYLGSYDAGAFGTVHVHDGGVAAA